MKTFVELITEVKQCIDQEDNKVLANIEDSMESTTVATSNHALGSYLIYDKKVYEVTTAISVGDTLVIYPATGYNIKVADDIMAMIETLRTENQTLTNKLDDEVETRAKLGAHQLLSYDLASLKAKNTYGTWNNNVYTPTAHPNLSFTVNADLSISVSGTSSNGISGFDFSSQDFGATDIFSYDSEGVPVGDYILTSNIPNGGANGNICFRYASSTHNTSIIVWGNQTVNVTVKPLIRYKCDPSTMLTPYAKTNRELTEYTSDVASASYTKDGILVRVYRCGRQVMLLLGGAATADIAAATVLCTLDSKFIPYEVVNSIAIKGANKTLSKLNISTNGQVYFDDAIANGEGPRLTSLCYIAKNP